MIKEFHMRNGLDTIEPQTLTTAEVCKAGNFSRSTLRIMIKAGTFPSAPLIVGKRGKRWPVKMMESWINGNNTNVTSRPGRPRSTGEYK